jgi:hypothetical protein
MFDTLFQVADWIKWLGVFGVFAGIALFFFAPSLAGVVGEFLKPLAKGFAEVIYNGVKNSFDTVAGIAVIGMLIFGTAYYFNSNCDCKPVVAKAIKDLRKDYKFVPRKQSTTQGWLPWSRS